MPDLILYTNPVSRGRTARWMLEEIGQPYDTVLLEFETTMQQPDYLAINPMGKVPALKHGDVIVTEVSAICAYLADAFPEAGLAPANRGAYYRWLFYGAGPLEAGVMNAALGVKEPDSMLVQVGYRPVNVMLDAVEAWLAAHAYIAGDAFSAADVAIGMQLGWGMQFGTIPERPAFKDYWKRLSARDAYMRAKAADDAAMPPSYG